MSPTSSLDDPRKRFLAAVTEHGLEHGMRSCEDFLRHFSPRVIMDAIGSDADLRALILEATLGMKRKVGLRKSASSAGEDLQIALEEGVTSPEAIVELFRADHRARYLDGSELWAYAIETNFWHATREDESWAMARDHLAHILERALGEQLLTPRNIIEGLSLALLVHHLPESDLEALLAQTLRQARVHEPFDEDAMLELIPPAVLCEHVPLVEIWNRVVVPGIAESHGLAGVTIRPTEAELPSDGTPHEPPLPKMPAGRLVSMPVPSRMSGRVIAPPPITRVEPIDSSTKRSSRAPRRSVPPKR